MEEKILEIFLRVRESFSDVKDRVSLLKPCFELHAFSPGWAMKLEEFEKILGFKPELIYRSKEEVYGISVIYKIDDDVTTGIIAHEFAEVVAREKGIFDHKEIDRICVERGFGEQLLTALQSDFLPGLVERSFIDGEELRERIRQLRELLKIEKLRK
ncbi:MAG: hypothetical protein DRO98_06695 [Archaeoglobales archaeon]|nr:MAG: hypothetical protein DRO98_06695 [Archaeoglobales archaeon]